MKLRPLVLTAACLAACLSGALRVGAQFAPPHDTSAIIAAIEEEKNAYLALDDYRLAATWIHELSSVKLYFADGKEDRVDGIDAINAHDRANLARERSLPPDRRTRFTFTNYWVTQQADSAWVTCHAQWNGYIGASPAVGYQTRVYVLRWDQGRWKIALLAITQLASPPTPDAVPVTQTPSNPSLLSMP
ncbi:MAG: hypothetical protein IAE82_19705 [Opitutaceae bacterium]|nr:hypothetical protein [Opitutaceae bacterium]